MEKKEQEKRNIIHHMSSEHTKSTFGKNPLRGIHVSLLCYHGKPMFGCNMLRRFPKSKSIGREDIYGSNPPRTP